MYFNSIFSKLLISANCGYVNAPKNKSTLGIWIFYRNALSNLRDMHVGFTNFSIKQDDSN